MHTRNEEPGCYKVEELLASTARATIFKTKDLWHPDRYVTVKMLKNATEAADLHAIRNEASCAASLVHPNVVSIYDFGIAPSALPYLVMEYVDGEDLSKTIKSEGSIGESRAVRIAAQVCAALSHAHSLGILHRHIKPSHIMVTPTKEHDELIKIVDWACASKNPLVRRPGDQTDDGTVVGTPFYMSPEQFDAVGDVSPGRFPYDARSEVYAVGCTIYEMLTGKPPLCGDNMIETAHRRLHETAEPFSVARPDLSVSSELERVVMRSLEREPSNRYSSMDELRKALLKSQATNTDLMSRFQSLFRR